MTPWEQLASRGCSHPIGNITIRDRVGMSAAVATLNASLRTGKYSDHLQWDTMRRTPTGLNNVYGAADAEEPDDVYAGVDKKMYSSRAPTASKWFGRFLLGAKRRMGVHRRQDEALTVDQLLAVTELAESDWQKSVSQEEKKEIESVMAFVVIGFCLSLRGEDVPLIVIEGLLKFWNETMAHDVPHMMIMLRGKFKGENNLRWHCVPLADMTKSRIPTRRWVSRLLSHRIHWEGNRSGYLFSRRNGKKASMGDYDPMFRDYLERAMKKSPALFSKSVALQYYSLRRSLRRGATTEAENNNVDPVTIELVNRWRKKEAAKGAEAGLTMRQVYTQVSRAVKAALRFSQSH